MRIAKLSSAAFLTLHNFSTLFLKIYEFREMVLSIKYLFRFPLQSLSEAFIILGRTEREMIKDVYWSLYKQPSHYTIFKEIDCLDIISKNVFISNIINIRPVWSEFFHSGRRTDRQDTDKVVFRMFAKVPISDILPMLFIYNLVFLKETVIVNNEVETNLINIWYIKDLSCGKCIGFPFLSRLFAISQYVQ
jgi:hypothetical protein